MLFGHLDTKIQVMCFWGKVVTKDKFHFGSLFYKGNSFNEQSN